jgi:hypothetical protein
VSEAAPARDPGLVYACLTHVPPWIAFPDYVSVIRLGEAQRDGALNLRDLAPDWEPHHPILGGLAGTFALRRYVQQHRPDATRVGICQYRKFVSRQRISGVPDPKYRVMDVVHKDVLLPPRFAALLDPADSEFLVTAPRVFTRLPWYRRGYLKEYARDHHVQDLLRYAAEAVEQGVLDRRELLPFCNEDVFIAGGIELGVYPAAFWLEHVAQMEAVTRACVERYPAQRDGYQVRAWAFCAERLGSWMLLRRFRGGAKQWPEWWQRRGWIQQHVGQLNLIVQSEQHQGYKGGV